jgi:hypothetical protein
MGNDEHDNTEICQNRKKIHKENEMDEEHNNYIVKDSLTDSMNKMLKRTIHEPSK